MPVCRLCPRLSFMDSDAVRIHKELKHGYCQTCDREFVSKVALDQHAEAKHPPRYCCDTCGTIFHSQQLLDQHTEAKHLLFERQHKEHWSCRACNREFVSKVALEQHDAVLHSREAHHTDKHPVFKCLYCECKFTTTQNLDQHEQFQHSLRYYCDTCDTVVHSQEALDQHHIDKHPVVKCLYCERNFTTDQEHLAHKEATHPPRFQCQHCDLKFRTDDGRRKHEDAEHPAMFECRYCGSADFASDEARLEHENAKHNLLCRVCHKAFKLPESRQQHEQAKHKHTPSEWMLRARVPSLAPDTREAQHPPRFECQYCDLEFITDDARRNHEDDEHHRAFEWQHGDLVFASDDARLQHENAENKLPCRYCNQAFILPESRQYHEEMNHILAFQCSCCRLNFHTMHERDAHEKSHHSYTVVGSSSAAQPVSSYLASLCFFPQPIRSEPSHISDTEGSQLASPATSQCSHAEVDEPPYDPVESQSSDEAQTSDEETSSLDQKDISHPSDDSPSIARSQDLICRSAIYEQPCTWSISQRPPTSPLSSACDDDKFDDLPDDASSIASGGGDGQDGPAEDFQAVCLCVSCSQVFDTDEDLRGHVCASRGTIFQLALHCSFCYIQFDDESSLLKHLEEDRMSFRCHLCQTLCCSNDTLQDHHRDHPICPRCGKVFIDDLALCNHVGLEHPVVVCWDCDGAVVEQDSLELPYAVSPEHPSCTFCGVGKRHSDGMEEPIKNHHATELYDSTTNEIEVSQSNGKAVVDGSSNVAGDEGSVLVGKRGDGRGEEALGGPEPPLPTPLQTDIPLSSTPPPTLPSPPEEAGYLVATNAASDIASVQLSAQHIKNQHATELHGLTSNDIEVLQSNEQVAIDGSSNASGDEKSVQVEKQPATDNGHGFGRGEPEPEPPSPTSVKETSSPIYEELHDPRTSLLQTKLPLSLSTASWLRSAVLLLITIYLYRRK
ncbi:hypothetical protein PAXINDRAFT_102894 [Paxillus involutus ATCC 200175]|uniref:C2H2-type domain-containing protein n=1 Tax=Paxillus involutus ATCC 200175 TaxID=664439 RepID=A0A0C9SX91_PAXIN|nr:hypothetical protein PAXINDRAFT_102894 [Paxillus involutus ATCC 200175]